MNEDNSKSKPSDLLDISVYDICRYLVQKKGVKFVTAHTVYAILKYTSSGLVKNHNVDSIGYRIRHIFNIQRNKYTSSRIILSERKLDEFEQSVSYRIRPLRHTVNAYEKAYEKIIE